VAVNRFRDAAEAAKEPIGNYATALELLDDLPAVIKHCYGSAGVTIAGHMLRRRKTRWYRSNPPALVDKTAAFAANALRNQDLSPDLRPSFEMMALVGWLVDAAAKGKSLD
jgi:hypothetical protein